MCFLVACRQSIIILLITVFAANSLVFGHCGLVLVLYKLVRRLGGNFLCLLKLWLVYLIGIFGCLGQSAALDLGWSWS